jgi:hypothetical protein
MRAMGTTLPTRNDVPQVGQECQLLLKAMARFRTSMTWRFALIQAVSAVFLYAALKLT